MVRGGRWGVALLVLWPLACTSPQLRLQSDDDDKDRAQTASLRTVGAVTSVSGTQPVRLYGIGVVTGLDGTGSDPEPGPLRLAVLRELKEKGVKDPAGFLSTKDVAVVKVTAYLMPATHKGDKLDVEIELDAKDRATSLRGGYLLPCELKEYADAHDLSGGKRGHEALAGKTLAQAEGPVLVGLGEANDKERLRRGRIWAGATSKADRNFILYLKQEGDRMASARISKQVATRINERFHGHVKGSLRGMAEAHDNVVITLKVPVQYKQNYPHYLRVVRNVPLRDGAVERSTYVRELGEELLDPAKALVAAVKLEAVGAEGIPILEKGLDSASATVRFASAQSLAYLGSPAGAGTLGKLCEEEPQFRAYAITALASLDESACNVTLRKLLQSPSAETRYGAFRGLRLLDESDPAIAGVYLNNSFFLHGVAIDSAPLVHVSTSRRAEIVLFGQGQQLVPPFALQAGPDFVVTAGADADTVSIARITPDRGEQKQACSTQLREIILTLAHLGATYPDVVELLQEATRYRVLTSRVAVDALPGGESVRTLAFQGVRESADKKSAEEDEGESLGMVPNLFANPFRSRAAAKLD